MKTQHTPGPWRVDPSDDGTSWIIGNNEGFIADCRCDNNLSEDQTNANSQLISASPDLLNALEDLFAMIQGEFPSILEDNHHFDKITAAIAKAKGEL